MNWKVFSGVEQFGARPRRAQSLCTCVSTGNTSLPNEKSRTHAAVSLDVNQLLHDRLICSALQTTEVKRPKPVPHCQECLLDSWSLLIRHASYPDCTDNASNRCMCDIFPAAKPLHKLRIGTMTVLIVRVLRENRSNKHLQWIGENLCLHWFAKD